MTGVIYKIVAEPLWRDAELVGQFTGAPADVAVFRLERGDFGFVDSDKLLRKGSQRLSCEMTLMGGNVMWDLNGRGSAPWENPASQVKK